MHNNHSHRSLGAVLRSLTLILIAAIAALVPASAQTPGTRLPAIQTSIVTSVPDSDRSTILLQGFYQGRFVLIEIGPGIELTPSVTGSGAVSLRVTPAVIPPAKPDAILDITPTTTNRTNYTIPTPGTKPFTVYRNGVRQKPGVDFTPNGLTGFTTLYPWLADDIVTVDFPNG